MRYLAGLLIGLLTPVSCGGDGVQGVSFRVLVAPLADGGRCPTDPTLAATTNASVDKIRLTFRAAQQGEFLCDIVVELAADNPILGIPEYDGLLDVHAEYFAGTQLVASGIVPYVDFNTPQLVDIVTTPANRFACALARLATGRAFHSATRLPGGEILIVGGITETTGQLSTAGGDPMFVGASVELYDPRFGEIRQIDVPGLIPRGFHEAVVLSGDTSGQVVIALIGGITVEGDPTRVPAVFTGSLGTNTMRLIPSNGARPAPLELLYYDPATGAINVTQPPDDTGEARIHPAISGGAQPNADPVPIVVAGGATDSALTPSTTFELRENGAAVVTANATLGVSRIGATATILADGSVLLWGGHVNVANADLLTNSGERLIGLETTASSVPLSYSALGVLPTPRIHHAAARVGDGKVVIAGGYRILDNRADDVDPTFVQVLDYSTQLRVEEPTTASGRAPIGAGYPATSTLINGDVLVSGGNSDAAASGCPGAVHPLTCSTVAAYRYNMLTGILDDSPFLAVSRYGHRTTALASGELLVTGGFHAEGQTLQLVDDLEIFNPATSSTDPLDDLSNIDRAPGDIARTPAGEPVSECLLIE